MGKHFGHLERSFPDLLLDVLGPDERNELLVVFELLEGSQLVDFREVLAGFRLLGHLVLDGLVNAF